MRGLLTYILILISVCSYAQTKKQVNGVFTIGGSNVSPAVGSDWQLDGLFNDLAGIYSNDSIAVGHVVWDNKCDRYVIDSVEFVIPNVRVHVSNLNGPVQPSTGIGLIVDETVNNDYPLRTEGVSDKLLNCIENHRAILIDNDVASTGQQDIQRTGDSLSLTGSAVEVSVRDDDSDPGNEIQTLAKVDSLVSLSGGGGQFVDEVDDADNDPNNEIELPGGGSADQKLTTDGAGGVYWGDDLTDDADSDPTNEFDTTTEADNAPASPKQGDVWIDTDDNETKKYDGSAWVLMGSTGIQIKGSYKNDADAAANGVLIGEYYRLVIINTLGGSAGNIRQRQF